MRRKIMNGIIACFLFLPHLLSFVHAGTPCPNAKNLLPCFCSTLKDGTTIVICSEIQNTTHLETATKLLKSQIIDRLILINAFLGVEDVQMNEVEEVKPVNTLPSKWLAELRVREIEILNGNLHSCFLCEEALGNQGEFLTSLTVKQAKLRGHICSTCTTGSTSVSTRGLRKSPKLSFIDLSFNEIEVLDGMAFPTLVELEKIVLSNNKISRIHDNAFQMLPKLVELDLSRNRLITINRRMFPFPAYRYLKTLDMSHNSIQVLINNTFQGLQGLREIKLSHNLLESLPRYVWSNIPLNTEKIDVKGNFLVCNCSMTWIFAQFGRNTKIYGQCVSPQQVQFQDLKGDLSTFSATCP